MKNEKNPDYGWKVLQMDEIFELKKIPIFFWKKNEKKLRVWDPIF
jgi:hypothetical protein